MKINESEKIIKHETNPFLIDLKGKMYLKPSVNTVVAKGEAIIDKATGELEEKGVLLGRKRIVDKSQFAKIYASEIGKLFELSKQAIHVFLYLSQKMDYENKAFFSYTSDYKKIGYNSLKPCWQGIKELYKNKIIAYSHMPHFYWLNPTIVCKGERFAIYTEYVKSEQEIIEGNHIIAKQIENENNLLDIEVKKKLDLANKKNPQLF